MANTYTQLYIHVVFAVGGRVNFIRGNVRDELYPYLIGILRAKKQTVLALNGMPDHLHILFGLTPDMAISNLVHDVKIASTRFLNEKGWFGGRYAWQEGFGAFSYSRSQLDRVAAYIRNQETHHQGKTFRQEYTELLDHFEVSYEERYLFEWYD